MLRISYKMKDSNISGNKTQNEDGDDHYCFHKNSYRDFKRKKHKNKYNLDEVYREKDKNKYLSYNKESTLKEIIAINKFLNYQNPYLINYSFILKEYQKITKIDYLINKFCYNSAQESYLKLRYRASEHKKLKNKDFEKIYNETQWPSVVIKTSINIYFIEFSDFEKNRYPPRTISKFYLFDLEEYILLEVYSGKINDPKIKKFISFYNNFSSGEFITDIKLKNKIIPKGMTFTIEDIEIFALRNKQKEEEKKNYIPLHSHLHI